MWLAVIWSETIFLKGDGAESQPDAAAEDVSEDTAQKVAMFAVSSFEFKAANELIP